MAFFFKRYSPSNREELLSLLGDTYSAGEKNLLILEKNFPCGQEGEIPLLGQDAEGRVVLMEAWPEEGEIPLMGILRRFRWISDNRSILARIFKEKKIDEEKDPHLVIFSPSSGGLGKEILSFLKLPGISLYSYTCLEMEGKRGLLLEEIFRKEEKGGRQSREEELEKLGKEEEEALKRLGKKVAASP